MTIRGLAALALAVVLGFSATQASADDPKLPDVKVYDKLVIDALREVHNKGADLYNTSKDFAGAYRVYQGSLVAVRPLLAHRPDAQKLIDAGLSAADKETDAARKAFLLHETIENVRKYLKVAIGERKPDEPKKPVDPPKKPVDPPVKPVDPPKKPVDPPKKPVDPPVKPVDPPVKKPDLPVAPPPKDVKPKEPKPAPTALVTGTVTLKGAPLAEGEVTFTAPGADKPKVVKAKLADDGTYKLTEAIPAGKYGIGVTGKGVPAKYKSADTSGLTFEAKAGKQVFDIDLK